MKTILISGNDTSIGKTWICRALVRYLVTHHQHVQLIKVVETGITQHQTGDAKIATEDCFQLNAHYCQAHTLYSFTDPLAPVTAARKAGHLLNFDEIVYRIKHLPKTSWRILETAGGLAVPLDQTGLDSGDLAIHLPVDYLILVVQNRLGTIHQARVLTAYAPYSKITTGIWLNDITPTDNDVTYSNYSELANLTIPIWGHQAYQSQALHYFESFPIAHYFKNPDHAQSSLQRRLIE